MKPDYKLVAKAKYIHNTADLANELWHEVYKRYYPAKQLDTLVEELQSAEAIEEDIDNEVNYFLVFLGVCWYDDSGTAWVCQLDDDVVAGEIAQDFHQTASLEADAEIGRAHV